MKKSDVSTPASTLYQAFAPVAAAATFIVALPGTIVENAQTCGDATPE